MKIITSIRLISLCMEKLMLTQFSNGGVSILLSWFRSSNFQTFLSPNLLFILSVCSLGQWDSVRQQCCSFPGANWEQRGSHGSVRVPFADGLISKRLMLMVLPGERQFQRESHQYPATLALGAQHSALI